VAGALDAAADRATLRGASAVAIAALERAADLTADPSGRALRLFRAAELSLELGRPHEAVRLLMAAQQLGLPPHERTIATFYLEALEGTWSGVATVRGVTGMARELTAAGEHGAALEALRTISLRAHWSNLDPETRQEITEATKQAGVPSGDPSRLAVLALVDPIRNGAELVERLRQTSPAAVGEAKDLLALGEGGSGAWADDLALPFLRAAAAAFRTDGRLALLAHAVVMEAWSDLHLGHVRAALTEAAEGARLSEETSQARYLIGAKLTQAVAVAELGEDAIAEDLIAEAEALLVPTGANPLLALVAFGSPRPSRTSRGSSTPMTPPTGRSCAGGRWRTWPRRPRTAAAAWTSPAATSPNGRRSRTQRRQVTWRCRSPTPLRSSPTTIRRRSPYAGRSRQGRQAGRRTRRARSSHTGRGYDGSDGRPRRALRFARRRRRSTPSACSALPSAPARSCGHPGRPLAVARPRTGPG
jgi:tetratricopeptide (TPR) repeat protein